MAEGNAEGGDLPTPGPIAGIRPPPPVCLDSNTAENWRFFKQKWRNYALITNLSSQSRQYQVALLLHVLGEQALKIYNGFTFTTTENNRTVNEILTKFDEFAIGQVNETYERYVFQSRKKNEGLSHCTSSDIQDFELVLGFSPATVKKFCEANFIF